MLICFSVDTEGSYQALRQKQSVRLRLSSWQSCSGWTSCRWPCRTRPTIQRESFSLCTQGWINDHSLFISVSLWEGWLTACWETVESVLFFSLWFTCLVGLKCSNKTYFNMNYNKINNYLDKQFVHLCTVVWMLFFHAHAFIDWTAGDVTANGGKRGDDMQKTVGRRSNL